MKMRKQKRRRGEHGYLMVGLLATMTISLVMMAAAVPDLKFHAQREREEEMLWRGQEVAQALLKYQQARAGQLPASLEELVEGVNLGVKKIRFLRPHALCDPMSPCTPGKSNWRLVHPGDPVILSMIQSLQAYQQKQRNNPQLVAQIAQSIGLLQRFAAGVILPGQAGSLGSSQPGLSLLGTQPTTNTDNPNGSGQTDGNDSSFGGLRTEQGPIIGVVSRSKDRPIRTMLDIENYDKELFFAGGTVLAGGFYTPHYQGVEAGPAAPRCPNGGVMIDIGGGPRCFGGLVDGIKPPSQRDK